MTGTSTSTVLGLTIGSSTIGWALLDGSKILAQGIRVFPTGTTGDIESGRDLSRNKRRQEARQRRHQLKRRAGRLKKLFFVLQSAGLLPPGDRHSSLEQVKTSPYKLRAQALDERLEPHELGRVIYHIAHRCGFKSNRRLERGLDEVNEKELGVVKTGILELEKSIRELGARTLGEYLYRQQDRIRGRWTSRAMYEYELGAILMSQSRWHDSIPSGLSKIVFDRKPLKSQAGRIGRCSLEPHHRPRMLLAHPLAQEFRILQKVNDLRAVDDLGAETVEITQAMRDKLMDRLRDGDATFADVRKTLGLPKTVRFNFERAEEKKLVGDRTRASIREALGIYPRNEAVYESLVLDLLTIDEEKGVFKRLVRYPRSVQEALYAAKLEDGYLALSARAVKKLLPLMRSGMPYATACLEVYGPREISYSKELPKVRDALPYLANPLVERSLSELRTLVTALVKKYGLPGKIRLELHRHLQTGPKIRQKMSSRMRSRQRAKEAAAERLLKEVDVTDPAPWQIERVLLADECGWACPITNRGMNMRNIFLDFYVAHLIPFHMSLDDDWKNKALVHVSVQDKRKDLLLSEVYGNNKLVEARFAEMRDPFAKKPKEEKPKAAEKKPGPREKPEPRENEKLRRFRMTRDEAVQEYDDAFADRFIESSSYAARTAREYLARLYGTDSKVEVTRGRVTSFVREATGLSRLRRDMQDDYRHHVLDAVSVAVTDVTTVKKLLVAAKMGDKRRFHSFPAPWESFVEDATKAAYDTTVSFRMKKRVRGPLHEETHYGRPLEDSKGVYHLIRKSLASLTKADLELIDGKRVQEVIVKAVGTGDPKKIFADSSNLPVYEDHRIRRVHVKRREAAFSVGSNGSLRYVTTEQNHHALVTRKVGKGDLGGVVKEIWTRQIVSLFEARQRWLNGQPVYGDGLFTIAPGEIFEVGGKLVRIRSVSKDPRIAYVRIEDCRKLEKIIESRDLGRDSVEQLRKLGIKKIWVDVLGVVRRDGT